MVYRFCKVFLSKSGEINNLVSDKNGVTIAKKITLSEQWKDFISTANHAFGINDDIMGLNNLICRIDVVVINNGYIIKKIISDFEKINYNVSFSLLNTSNFGLAQNRERVYFVCTNKDRFVK